MSVQIESRKAGQAVVTDKELEKISPCASAKLFVHKGKRGLTTPNLHYYGKSPQGKQYIRSTGTRDEQEAQIYVLAVLREMWLPKYTLLSVRDQYLETRSADMSKSYRETIIEAFSQFVKYLGSDIDAKSVTVEQAERFISGYHAWRRSVAEDGRATMTYSKSPYTPLRHCQILKAAFKQAKRWGCVDNNPFEQLSRPRVTKVKREFLTDQEFDVLYAQLPTNTEYDRMVRLAILLGFDTGGRYGEILHIRYCDIDWTNKVLHIRSTQAHKTKNRQDRDVPLSERVYRALMERKEHVEAIGPVVPQAYIFAGEKGTPITQVSRCFKKVAQSVFPDRPNLRFHSLRHSYGTRLVNGGVALTRVRGTMGHGDVRVTAGYLHSDNNYTDIRAVLDEKERNDRKMTKSANVATVETRISSLHWGDSGTRFDEYELNEDVLATLDLSQLQGQGRSGGVPKVGVLAPF